MNGTDALHDLVDHSAGTRWGLVASLLDTNVVGTLGSLEWLDPFLRIILEHDILYQKINVKRGVNLRFVW